MGIRLTFHRRLHTGTKKTAATSITRCGRLYEGQIYVALNCAGLRLFGHHKVGSAIVMPAHFVAFKTEGLFFPIADGKQPIFIDTQIYQIFLQREF